MPEPAVAVGVDPRDDARSMSAVHDATMAGQRAPARLREVIGDSWRRMLARGISPDEFGGWCHDLSLRHAEILCVLARSPQGRTAPQLADDLYGDRSRVVTVRAEMSRLRKQFTGLLAAQPYRFAGTVGLQVRYPGDLRALLPPSTASAIRVARMEEDG